MYFTTHRGVAAALLYKGHNFERLERAYDNRKGREVTKLYFNCDISTGREIGDDFFANRLEIDAKDFYDKLGEISREIRSAK